MIALLASLLIATNATPHELVSRARIALPSNMELSGRLILRNRRGIVQAEHDYVLTRQNAQTALQLDKQNVVAPKDGRTRIAETDVTWSDITLEYLWWDDVSFDEQREGETVNGQVCAVVVLRQGGRTVRVWVDRKTGALLQAEEYCEDKPVRRLWGTRIRKFNDRWMANVLEVETLGSGRRTKVTVEEMK